MRSNFIKNKQKILILGIMLILLIILIIICFLIPKIDFEIKGDMISNIGLGENYKKLNIKAYYQNAFEKKEIKVKTSGNVDNTKIGRYVINYTTNYKGIKREIIQIVNVIDNIKPEISLVNSVTACKKSKSVNINAKAIDNYDGDLTDKIKYRIDDDKIYISVTDSSNNTVELIKELEYIDNEKPVIKLNGNDTIYLKVNEEYEELGATATDSCDGDISKNLKITGNIDNTQEGEYEINYSITDSFGNEVIKSRKIVVANDKEIPKDYVTNGTIYLTFDDGPGQYTADFLEVLAKYDIKATFFVTGQFPKYYDLIAKEYEQGHTIGVHTYSHKWSIYESVDTYLEDFKKIEDIIYEKTATRPKYFRFPGGSSNTVSRKYCDKIMTNLSKIMEENGYIYYDWTFDSGDTVKGKNTKEEIIKTVKSYLKGNGDYIILMHDLKKATLEALPTIIEYAKNKGYIFKAIDENTPIKHFKIAN